MIPGHRRHENIVKLQRQILRKLCRVLMVANIFILLVTHLYQSTNKDDTDVFKQHGIIKWIYYTFEALYVVAHLIVSMDLSSRSIFRHMRTMFGTLGFETLLLMLTSYTAWFLINVAILEVALLCSLGSGFLHNQPTNTPTLNTRSIPEVRIDLPESGPTETGLDGNYFV